MYARGPLIPSTSAADSVDLCDLVPVDPALTACRAEAAAQHYRCGRDGTCSVHLLG